MASLDQIKKPVEEHIKKFEPYFKRKAKSKVPLLDIITNYVIRRKGKQMRPLLVFLTAKLVGKPNESTYTAAAMIELLHTATLIHDDVVDEAYYRRGFFSVKALWKSKIAVLVGDFFLSKGLLLATETKEYQLLEIVSEAVKEMAEGELIQLEKSRKLDITEKVYFDIIKKKTATLIAACAAAGAKSSGATEEQTEEIKNMGKYIGVAFQIKDDLFDYQKTNVIGKPSGNDIQEKKITLPMIYALNTVDKKEQKRILKIIASKKKTSEMINTAVNFVKQNGGLEYAEKMMNKYRDKALEILQKYPDSETRQALIDFVHFVIKRKK